MLRRLVIIAAILLGLLALADRALASFAGSAAADAIAKSEKLGAKPSVSFRGFPFVTQAVRGRFSKVEITARDIKQGELRIDRIDATLTDVKVGLGDALGGKVEAVPVGDGRATVRLTYADLNAYLAKRPEQANVSLRDTKLFVRGRVQGFPAEGEAVIRVGESSIRVDIRNPRTTEGPPLPRSLTALVIRRLSFTLNLGDLPFGIQLRKVDLQPDALELAADARAIVIQTR